MSIARLLLIAAVFTSFAACGGEDPAQSASSTTVEGQATWHGTGGPCSELAEVEADKQMKENVGAMTCAQAGKTFNGELRCARDFIEVGCR